jgi:hypothetical protein
VAEMNQRISARMCLFEQAEVIKAKRDAKAGNKLGNPDIDRILQDAGLDVTDIDIHLA